MGRGYFIHKEMPQIRIKYYSTALFIDTHRRNGVELKIIAIITLSAGTELLY